MKICAKCGEKINSHAESSIKVASKNIHVDCFRQWETIRHRIWKTWLEG